MHASVAGPGGHAGDEVPTQIEGKPDIWATFLVYSDRCRYLILQRLGCQPGRSIKFSKIRHMAPGAYHGKARSILPLTCF